MIAEKVILLHSAGYGAQEPPSLIPHMTRGRILGPDLESLHRTMWNHGVALMIVWPVLYYLDRLTVCSEVIAEAVMNGCAVH